MPHVLLSSFTRTFTATLVYAVRLDLCNVFFMFCFSFCFFLKSACYFHLLFLDFCIILSFVQVAFANFFINEHIHYVHCKPKNMPQNFCPHVCGIFIDFRSSFTGSVCRKCASKRISKIDQYPAKIYKQKYGSMFSGSRVCTVHVCMLAYT